MITSKQETTILDNTLNNMSITDLKSLLAICTIKAKTDTNWKSRADKIERVLMKKVNYIFS
jgi:hypothetical protein